MKSSADLYWKVFETTGAITAYIIYKQYRKIEKSQMAN